jgi:hypothetical protein
MTPAELKQAVSRGAAVEQFLDSSHVKDLWSTIEAEICQMWATTKSDAVEKREELYRELHGLRALKAKLRGAVQAGIRAEHELNHGE